MRLHQKIMTLLVALTVLGATSASATNHNLRGNLSDGYESYSPNVGSFDFFGSDRFHLNRSRIQGASETASFSYCGS